MTRKHMAARILLAPLVWLVCAGFAAPAVAEDALKRWALVTAPSLRESGLADLLVAEATKLPGIELVERDELARITDELAIGPLSAAEGVAGRLNAGRLLRADALMLVSPARGDPVTSLRVVICDCRQGARLAAFETTRADGSPEETAKVLTAEIARVRTHYGGGIRLVVGVPPLVSQNLEHRYDHLQSRYADLVAGSLSLQPGIAVIEVDEARAILKERLLGDAAAVRRTVPVVLSGRFRMSPAAGASEPLVELSIDLASGDNARTLPTQKLPLSRVPAWLVHDLAGQVLASAGEKFTPLDNQQQREALIRQADAFNRLGDWPRAAGLREAALVLDPQSAVQRARLIDEYQQRFVRDFSRLWAGKGVAAAQRLPLLEQSADRYISALEHLEYLVRNRLIAQDEATVTFGRQKWEGRGSYFDQIADRPAPEKSAFERVLEAERRFIVEVCGAVRELPREPALPETIVPATNPEPWHDVLLRRVMNQVEYCKQDRPSLEFLAQVLTQVLPDDAPTSYSIELFLRQQANRLTEERFANDEVRQKDWATFLRTLVESDHDTARLYGRLGLLAQSRARLGDFQSADREAIVRLLRETDEILYEYVGRRPQSDDVFHTLFATRRVLLGRLDPALNPDSPKDLSSATSLGRLRFRPLDLRLSSGDKPLTGYAQSAVANVPQPPFLFQGMLRCDKFDAYWTDKTFFLMHEPGVLRPLPLAGNTQWSRHGAFSHVAWDGQCLWLLVAGWGIHVLDADGNLLTMFNSATPLPGIDKGLQLLALGPRRALAAGSFGEHNRAWCGLLEVSADNKPSIRVFHEATRVPDGRPSDEVKDDVHSAFLPAWIHRFQEQGGRESVLLGRHIPIDGGVSLRNRPLTIDLETLSVGQVEYETRGFPGNGAMFSREGHLLHASSSVFHFPPRKYGDRIAAAQKLFDHPFNYYHELVPHDGWVYVPGRVWRRIRQDTFDVEYLLRAGTVLPPPYTSLRHGVSAHFGLIGYRSHLYGHEVGAPVLFQVTIADKDP